MLILACGNSLALNTEAMAVADFGPFGIGGAAILLHVLRFRRLSFSDRVLALVFGALIASLMGALIGLRFRVTPMSASNLPLLLSLVGWLHVRPRIAPSLLRKELDPHAAGFILSRARAAQLAAAQNPSPAPLAPTESSPPAIRPSVRPAHAPTA